MHHAPTPSGVASATPRSTRPGRVHARGFALGAAFLMFAGSALPSFGQAFVTQYNDATGPVGLALDTVAGVTFLYVADEAHGNVLKINTATGAVAATFGTGSQGNNPGQFGRPYGVAVDPTSHDLYVTERLNGRVQRINSTTGASVMTWGVNDAAFNTTGQNVNPANPTSPPGHFQEPVGVAADSSGNVYVVDHGNNRVQKFLVHQVNGTWTADNVAMWGTTGAGNGQFDHPYGAALDAAGNIWVADGLNGRVQKFDASGNFLGVLGSKGTAAGQFVIATWVNFDATGALYVTSTNSDPQNGAATDANNQWVSKFTVAGNSGTFVSRFGGTYGSGQGEFRLPFDVVVDASNRAYVSDYYNSRVQVLNLSAAPTGGSGGTTGGGTGTGTGSTGGATAPSVTSFGVTSSTASSATFTLTFSAAVTGVDATDFTVTPSAGVTATIGTVAGSGTTYTIPVSYTGSGTVQLALKASGTGIADSAGTAFTNSGTTSATFNTSSSGGSTGGSTGGSGGSSAVSVASATVPANGTYRAGDALVFKVHFSAAVMVSGAKAGEDDDSSAAAAVEEADKGDAKAADDDDEGDGGLTIAWTALSGSDSGRATYVGGSGTTDLTFKYQVHGNDSAPTGIRLGTTIDAAGGAQIKDAAGHALTASQLTIAWAQNPLPGVVLVPANVSNPGVGNGNSGGKDDKKGKLVNLSSRLKVKGGDATHAVVVGFVVAGSTLETVLIRAIGPGLHDFGITDALTDPSLTIQDSSGHVVATNGGWNNDASVAQVTQKVGAFGLKAGSRDSALVLTLPPGAYTATIGAKTEGEVLIEVYDATSNTAVLTPQLVNISTRGFVDPEGNLIAGFVVSGTAPKRVLVRAIGPGLAAFGVPNPLADPALEVHDGNGGIVARNNDWGTPMPLGTIAAATAADIAAADTATGAFPLTAGSKDAAAVVTLPPGAYTAVVGGPAKSSGAVLVEVYELATP